MNVMIKSRSGNEHIMTVETYARWLCLIEGLDVITKAGEANNIDLNKDTSWVKPIALQNYIEERFPAMLHDICVEENIDLTPTPNIEPAIPLNLNN